MFYVPDSKTGKEVTFTNDRVFIDDVEIGVLMNKLYVLNKGPEYEETHFMEGNFVDDGHIEQDQTFISKESINSLKIELLQKRFAHTNVAAIKDIIKCGACIGLEKITH